MQNSELGNIITRLQGLKNVNPRRVMPGEGILQENNPPPPDVEGTASQLPDFSAFLPPAQNKPEPDLGGELTSQSYDVRANTVTDPEEKEADQENAFMSVLRRAGSALGDYFNPQKRQEVAASNQQLLQKARDMSAPAQEQPAPIESEPVNAPAMEAQQPQLRAKAPEASPGLIGMVSDYFNPTKRNEMAAYNQDIMQDARIRAQGNDPDQVRGLTNENQNVTHEQQRALQDPWKYSAYGSAEQVANSPALSAEFKKITGINYEPQIAAQVTQYEEAMKGVEDRLNGLNTQLSEQADGINRRILENQTTNADKYFIGMALLMPLLVGGLFGKQAGLGALSGAAQGFSNVLQGRQKSIRDDESALLDLSKQQASNEERLANIGVEKSKFGPALRKSLPEDENEHLFGMQQGIWQDPVTGKEVRGVEIKPGLIAKPEFVASKEGKADMLKAANELSAVKTYVDEVNDITEDVANIVSQLSDPSAVWKGFTSILAGKSPTILAKMTQDVMVDGRRMNAGTALEEKLGFLANAYGQAKDIGQLDRAAQAHIKKIIENPTSTFLTPEDSLNQVLEVRKLAQRGLVQQAQNQGFYPEFVIRDLEKANNPLFQRLNQSEDERYNEQLKKEAFQSEMNYAQ